MNIMHTLELYITSLIRFGVIGQALYLRTLTAAYTNSRCSRLHVTLGIECLYRFWENSPPAGVLINYSKAQDPTNIRQASVALATSSLTAQVQPLDCDVVWLTLLKKRTG